ncbi:DUF742 domain-containing protein [Actinacidiphila guanduensis]|uniref:DUF742 domain-containing protein n=1 Tax=Actinacidiphila guanduensis TaxID=310781 RepID=A0A1H0IVH8_9ACTN|nr:DUF742 domain-containing protein [Actinacidiphila guanduensis]SDO35524.1 Protein of unknown function [Actinacidiphila guanduensis]
MSADRRRDSPFVRPYAVTRGRTTARTDFAMEALVGTTMLAWERGVRLFPEQLAICRLCVNLTSIAEISALLNIPLQVTRVLVGDLAENNYVNVQQPAYTGGRPDVTLLERVLTGLRGL